MSTSSRHRTRMHMSDELDDGVQLIINALENLGWTSEDIAEMSVDEAIALIELDVELDL